MGNELRILAYIWPPLWHKWFHHHVQNGSGAHPASYPMVTRGSSSGVKAAGEWSWPLTSTYCRGQRIRGAIPTVPHYAFMVWCSVKAQGQFYLYLFTVSSTYLILHAVRFTDQALWPVSVENITSEAMNLLRHFGRVLWTEDIGPSQGLYLHRLHIHASSGFRTQSLTVLAIEHISILWPRSHWDYLWLHVSN